MECHSVTLNLRKERELEALMAIKQKVYEKDVREKGREVKVFILEGV